jgi:uridine kinase
VTRTWWHRTAEVAELLVWSACGQEPTLGRGRLICVDGPAGSGKTSLARALVLAAAELGSARLLHMDDMYEGWSGLGDVSARIDRDLLRPLAACTPGRYRRYDWHEKQFAEWHTVDPLDVLVLEGVGSGASVYDDLITTLVWVEAPRETRISRGIDRDGEQVREHWMAWMADEDRLYARERTKARADVLVDGTGTSEQPVVFC